MRLCLFSILTIITLLLRIDTSELVAAGINPGMTGFWPPFLNHIATSAIRVKNPKEASPPIPNFYRLIF